MASIQNEHLMSHQDGLGDNGPDATGLSNANDGDDCMQKKSENVAHGREGIKPMRPRIQWTCGIRLRQVDSAHTAPYTVFSRDNRRWSSYRCIRRSLPSLWRASLLTRSRKTTRRDSGLNSNVRNHGRVSADRTNVRSPISSSFQKSPTIRRWADTVG